MMRRSGKPLPSARDDRCTEHRAFAGDLKVTADRVVSFRGARPRRRDSGMFWHARSRRCRRQGRRALEATLRSRRPSRYPGRPSWSRRSASVSFFRSTPSLRCLVRGAGSRPVRIRTSPRGGGSLVARHVGHVGVGCAVAPHMRHAEGGAPLRARRDANARALAPVAVRGD